MTGKDRILERIVAFVECDYCGEKQAGLDSEELTDSLYEKGWRVTDFNPDTTGHTTVRERLLCPVCQKGR